MAYDAPRERWDLLCSGVPGLDLVVTTPHGVMGVDHYWDIVEAKVKANAPNSVYLLDAARRRWNKLPNPGPSPQNLYEMTALAYDSKRDRLILHGGGPRRDELWVYRLPGEKWEKMDSRGDAPVCQREAVYLPRYDVVVTAGYPAGSKDAPSMYAYHVGENRWERLNIAPPPGRRAADFVSQNRACAYDAAHDVILMVLGESRGNLGRVQVYALRYRPGAQR
jgi:hypothetical protein